MELNRRDLLFKCMALGVVKLSSGLSPALAVEAWLKTYKAIRQATPTDELGPFYKRDAPHTATLCSASDPGMPLRVAGVVYSTRGEILPGAKIEVWHASHLGHYDLSRESLPTHPFPCHRARSKGAGNPDVFWFRLRF